MQELTAALACSGREPGQRGILEQHWGNTASARAPLKIAWRTLTVPSGSTWTGPGLSRIRVWRAAQPRRAANALVSGFDNDVLQAGVASAIRPKEYAMTELVARKVCLLQRRRSRRVLAGRIKLTP